MAPSEHQVSTFGLICVVIKAIVNLGGILWHFDSIGVCYETVNKTEWMVGMTQLETCLNFIMNEGLRF